MDRAIYIPCNLPLGKRSAIFDYLVMLCGGGAPVQLHDLFLPYSNNTIANLTFSNYHIVWVPKSGGK